MLQVWKAHVMRPNEGGRTCGKRSIMEMLPKEGPCGGNEGSGRLWRCTLNQGAKICSSIRGMITRQL